MTNAEQDLCRRLWETRALIEGRGCSGVNADMLAALKALDASLKKHRGAYDWINDPATQDAFDKMRAAIDKAEGC